jgi:ATP-binding cassette, subfamily B, bacterial MsbA
MKSFISLFRFSSINKPKLALYMLLSLLATFFSMLTLGMLSPFMQLIINGDNNVKMDSKAVGSLIVYIREIRDNKGSLHALGLVCIFIIISNIVSNVFRYMSSYISSPVRNEIYTNLRIKIYEKILRLPMGYFSEQKKGDIMSRTVGDVGEIQASIIAATEGLIKDPITILVAIASMIYVSPMLSLALLLLLPVTALLIGSVGKRLKKQGLDYSILLGQSLSQMEETLAGMKVIKIFGAEGTMLKKFKIVNDGLFNILNSITRRKDLSSPITEIMAVTVLSVILFIGGYLVFNQSGELQRADLFPFIGFFAMMINPAKNLANTISNIQRGLGAVTRVADILDTPITVQDSPEAIELTAFNNQIEFRNVSFRYNEAEVLKNINFIIKKGQTIAFVGSSGAGKSTLVDLLPRFHDVTGGEILIDGINIKDYTTASLRKQMSFVTQEPVLFNDTVAANISLGYPNAPLTAIEKAATIANAHQFILHKENGYDTIIGDRGSKLSGGERQRITIARAVLQNPSILILDEATSSLDTESERLVQDAIMNVTHHRTSLVIAHRLSTIRNADKIIVMQHGQITETGTHDELIAVNGFYKKLVDMQEIR